MRSGILAKKLGMSRLFREDGVHVPVTLLSLDDCVVVSHKTKDRDGYNALQVGSGVVATAKLAKPLRRAFEKNEALSEGRRKMVEFRIDEDHFLDPGHVFSADYFSVDARVDVTGTSKGKGFQGPMKRHNFGGLRASHGVSISHRSHGSIGQRSFPGKVFKNKKMAGHMGDARVTVQSLRVAFVDVDKKWIALEGGIPGPRGSYVMVRDAVKKSLASAV
ncbi:50S ribosomal protein L3 [Candidatus Hepatobacter penaei]|uniref:50S ribosomal protein L3 n=1 Tax=Candidatus Hepatobacter penaei TaxID=1274402 RepID=UPI0004F3CD5F|nr:50S ribosomal protein L3 [Candidatus Hepatobacter penaei]TGW15889.1 50S ribosomal protein L3 [bacterium NHP-B]